MKNIYFLIILLLSISAYAQTEGFSYQAVILNPNKNQSPNNNTKGNALPNKTITVRFTITNENGSYDYQETQTTTTDTFSMINVFIGQGNQISEKSFKEINWDGTPKNLKVDLSFDGGNSFTPISEQKLTFIPYAFHRNITATGNLTLDGIATFNDDLIIEGKTIMNNDLTVTGNTLFEGEINILETASLEDNLTVEGQTQINNDITITGDTNINENLHVNGSTILNGSLNVDEGNATVLSGTLIVDGISTFNDDFIIEGETIMNNGLSITGNTSIDGSIDVIGEATFNNNLNVEGNTVVANLVVKGGNNVSDGTGANHIALFENTGGENADGIAIRIDQETLGIRNRFITFYGKGNYMAGRIESYDLLGGDLWESFPIPDFSNIFQVFDFDNVLTGGTLPSLQFNGGSLPSASFSRGSLPSASFSRGSLPSINFLKATFSTGSLPSLSFNEGSLPNLSFQNGALPTLSFSIGSFPTLNFDGFFDPQIAIGAASSIGSMVAWGMRNGDPGFTPSSPFQLALVPLVLAAKQLARNQGVVYGSKGADYAEWLEKENLDDKFMFGEVVGVKGGKISRNTENADQVMSISLAPIVLGNMPDENVKENFEKVGFMGQVPVLVLGDVEVGDYIVASGYNDGYAKAISSENIVLKDLKGVIGKAWSSSNGNKASLINVSIGLKTNEWVDILKQQEARLNKIESKLNDFIILSDKLEKLESLIKNSEIN